eukprot:GDKH01003761.1.p1 GENE.GDKH01003761.1~~GDKH01003761.1.p1  ORF type:complete len:327 (+),score=10.66 GDKH01003761.1:104-1084(+)
MSCACGPPVLSQPDFGDAAAFEIPREAHVQDCILGANSNNILSAPPVGVSSVELDPIQLVVRDLHRVSSILIESIPELAPHIAGMDILPMTPRHRASYHGVCRLDVKSWAPPGPTTRFAEVWKARTISLAISNVSGSIIGLEMIMATFLHELAHCLTPPSLRRADEGSDWTPDDHNPEFYESFARILRAAEELDVFHVPSRPAKFSRHALLRYDRIGPDTLVGSVGRNRDMLALATFRRALEAENTRPFTLRVAERHQPGTTKVIALQPPVVVTDVVNAARRKFNSKRKAIALFRWDPVAGSHMCVTDAMLADRAVIEADSLLLVG